MDKFFKINPSRVFSRMYGYDPIIQHRHIFDSMNEYENTVIAATRRGGKTKSASAAVIAKFLEPNTETMILAPQHSLTENIFFNNVYRFIKDAGIETTRANLKDKIIEGANGSRLYARSLQRATSIVGVGLDLAVMDEIALTEKENWWEQELRPTLTEKEGHTLWISTPRGHNHFKERFDDGQNPDIEDWNSIRYTIWDLPYIRKEYAEKLKNDYFKSGRELYFRQEFEASFEAFSGQIYSIPPVIETFEKNQNWDMVIAGLDVGFNHSTAFIIIGVADNKYFVLDYYKASKKTTNEHAAAFKQMMDKYNVDLIYIDSAAAQFAWDLVILYDITTLKANKSVLDGIARVQTLLGNKQLIIHSSLWDNASDLRKEFSVYRWQGSEDEPKEQPVKLNDDILDALRYAIYTFDLSYNIHTTELEDNE